MPQILQASPHQYLNVNFQMFKLDLEKGEEPQIKLLTAAGSSEKQESSRKNLHLLYWLRQRSWLCGPQQTVENSYWLYLS